MNSKAIYKYLSVRLNRQSMIKKIENGLKNKSIKYTKDPEVEKFQKGFLENWNDLDKFKPAAEDLEGLEGEEKKNKIKELKIQFCEWVSGEDAIAEGYMYASEKREQIKGQIKGVSGSMASKAKAAVDVVLGRKDPCPCGSGKRYKNCCNRRFK